MIASARPPRLLVVTDTYAPQVNGVSVVTALSVRGLAERGWEVAVVAPRYPEGAFDAFGGSWKAGISELLALPSVPLPVYPDIRLSWPNGRAIGALMDRFRPDLVHCATEFFLGAAGQRQAIRRGLPVVSSYHTDFSRYTEAYGLGGLRPYVSRYIARFHRRSVRTYTPSVPARDDLLAMGVAHSDVWGRGVDVDTFHPRHRSTALRGAYGRRETAILLHVGRMAAEKGVDRILAAYALARARLPGAMHLIVAGAGPCADALRATGAAGISFLGNLDRETVLPRLYASADAFLFSSLTETLGLVVLEAMASGLPVIATPAGGVADHLRHGENGLAVPPHDVAALADAIVRIVQDRSLAAALGKGARATAEALSWEHELGRLDASYREICGREEANGDRHSAPLAASA